MLDMTGLDDGFPVIGEMPRCSEYNYNKNYIYICISYLSASGHIFSSLRTTPRAVIIGV